MKPKVAVLPTLVLLTQVAIDRPPNGVTTTSSDKMMYEFGHSLFGPVGKDLV